MPRLREAAAAPYTAVPTPPTAVAPRRGELPWTATAFAARPGATGWSVPSGCQKLRMSAFSDTTLAACLYDAPAAEHAGT
eukprot:5757817-Pleurochrysis_carterae.AAC.1